MGDLGVYVVFFFGGAIFANFAPVGKFLILAVTLGLVNFGYHLIIATQFSGCVISSLCAFAFVQIGYVSGLAIKIVYVNLFSKSNIASHYGAVIEEKTRTK